MGQRNRRRTPRSARLSAERQEREPFNLAHPHRPAAQSPAPVDRRLLAATACVTTVAAILVRCWFPRAWDELQAPASVFYQGDARAFLAYASHLVAGAPFDNGVPFHPPGWPFVLSLFFRAMGFAPLDGRAADPGLVKLFVATISGLTVGLTTVLAARFAGTGAMLAAALLGTFHFGHVAQGSVPTSEPLYGLLVVLVLLLACCWSPVEGAMHEDRARPLALVRRVTGSVMLGTLVGFTSLVRAEFLVCALAIGFLQWRATARNCSARLAARGESLASPRMQPDFRHGLLEVGAYMLGLCLALAPTTVWHWQSVSAFNASRAGRIAGPLPRFAPVTSYGAFAFAIANHADADGGPNRDHPLLVAESPSDDTIPSQGELDFASPAVYDLYVHGYGIGLRWLVTHPGDAAALWWKKAAMTSGVFAYGYLQDNLPVGIEGTRRRVDQLDPARRGLWPIHVGLVLVGAWRLRRGGSRQLLLIAPLLAFAASVLLVYGYVRLGVAYLPIFWVFQGAALSVLASSVNVSDTWRRRVPALVLLAAIVLLVAEAAGTRRPRLVTLDGLRDSDGAIVQDETLEIRRAR